MNPLASAARVSLCSRIVRRRAGVESRGCRLASAILSLLAAGCTETEFPGLACRPAGRNPDHDPLVDCSTFGQRALDIHVCGQGQVRPAPGRTCHEPQAIAELDAVADAGWMFIGWCGDFDSPFADVHVRMEHDVEIRAVFERVRDSQLPQLRAAWPAGLGAEILQGPFGPYTHAEAWAWDVRLEPGTPVLAAEAGVVVDLREDQPSPPPGDPVTQRSANFVMLDHGDGLLSRYVHLDQMGVIVEVGQRVQRGEVVGISGNSGLSFEPHLHFETLHADGTAAPCGLAESDRPDGLAREGDVVVSRNRPLSVARSSPR